MRSSMALASRWAPTASKSVMGSMMTFRGLNSLISLCMAHQVHLEPKHRGPRRQETQQAFLHPLLRSMPIELMFRENLAFRLLESKIRAPLAAPARRIHEMAAKLVLPVPAVPLTRTVLPRK